jgi:putative SOS response-associated peptidase YedK
MCGRFSFKHEWPDFVDLHDLLWDVERCRNTRAGRNTAPTRQVLMVYNEANGRR